MKNYVFLLLVLICFSSYSQEKMNGGRVSYDMFLSFSQTVEYTSVLLFSTDNSNFTYKVKDGGIFENYDDLGNQNTAYIDTVTSQIILDRNKGTLYESYQDKGLCYSTENIPMMNWELLSGKKVIQGIDCFLAKTNFRGRIFYAWYAPSIPLSYGPWKLNGLPGLILESYDETKEVLFLFKSIKIPFGYKLRNTENIRKITLSEYLNQRNIHFNKTDLEKKIKTRFPRGATVEVEIKRTGIELNYVDIINVKN